MRHEIIHLLSHVKDEQTMSEVLASLNAEAYESLQHHLRYTSPETQERWRELLNKMLR
ncbi:hypothetical protein [Cohnella cellulosilytica]|uniref:Uncharacterized protein n=1 Tax=Cohnella cellulosilytica TaxID=986710 RepID=A0ABW2FBA8_9BACL